MRLLFIETSNFEYLSSNIKKLMLNILILSPLDKSDWWKKLMSFWVVIIYLSLFKKAS